ncbi:hypothetical protein PSN45_001416 [Yamadazyma tenuis]|uniref:Cytochrome b560 subunit of succinate dehydrogenase n=1 Tax=Candida tenuis (strain ATCC 10573 / BCRC 21748 / CBS 615 / JCM 9827 / NBRC 10315 / NRRL Y-1498 / VKM Y-70) TaxID=590646 RepID=G3BC55_CANTC|nr:cytochrome b560 subunit of succinate dehydrogenase [Yamadazyma tenuis ATCC 10573]EGV60792.1 cytochrome b560 subunit of succinate dehydrogenase [Yamadazyma tenuis ATCC 10573]WEJ93939.1 hypothetical protein PSN45_001416 [Yamadazyma tenuis]
MLLTRVGLGLGLKRSTQVLRYSPAFARYVSTIKASHDEEQAILVQQRKNRPGSPHLEIYQPQLTWVLSSFHRITGVLMAFGFYGLTCGYAASSVLGYPLDVNSLIAAFGSLPLVVKIGAKAGMAFPFVFHSFNGLRHLLWDSGRELTVKGVYRTGYVVLALTGVLGTYFTFM